MEIKEINKNTYKLRMLLVLKNALIYTKDRKPYNLDIFIMDEQNKSSWKVWAFVIGLNVVGLLGVTDLQSKEINVFAIRGGPWLN